MADSLIIAERLNRRLRELILMLRRATAGQPLGPQQVGVMGSLEAGARSLTELAAEHGVRLPTMTRLIGRLARDGLVIRSREGVDARVVTAELTGMGRERLQQARGKRVAFLAARLETLTDDERAAIEAALPAMKKLFADISK